MGLKCYTQETEEGELLAVHQGDAEIAGPGGKEAVADESDGVDDVV